MALVMKKKTHKAISITKQLNLKLGGKWKYEHRSWYCDDDNRYVNRVAMGLSEDAGTGYYLYFKDNKKTPEWLYFI